MSIYDASDWSITIDRTLVGGATGTVTINEAVADTHFDRPLLGSRYELAFSSILRAGKARRLLRTIDRLRRLYRRFCVPYAKGQRLPKPRGRRAKAMQRELWARHLGGAS